MSSFGKDIGTEDSDNFRFCQLLKGSAQQNCSQKERYNLLYHTFKDYIIWVISVLRNLLLDQKKTKDCDN